MTRRGSEFSGVSVALVTPFRDGKIDSDLLREQVEFQVAAGVTCLIPTGTTGESPTLTHDEHERVIAEVVQAVAGRIKVMAGTGSNSTDEAIRLTRWAAKEGADAALMVAPYYNKPTQEGFYQHYRAIAETIEIPICVYNIPGRTGKNIEPETIIRLAELPTITMVKEATGSLDQASQILCTTDLTLLSGDDSLTLPLLSVGAEGVISVVANIVPLEMKHVSITFEFSKTTESSTNCSSPSAFKKPNILVLVSSVTFLFPQSIHSSTVPVLKTLPSAIIRFIPSLIWYSPPFITFSSKTS